MSVSEANGPPGRASGGDISKPEKRGAMEHGAAKREDDRSRKNALRWIANGNVLGWSAFWVFGFLAVTAPAEAAAQMVGAAALSFAGLVLGMWCWLRLMRGQV